MSKLKDMKNSGEKKDPLGFLYNVLGIAVLLAGVAIIYFVFTGSASHNGLDPTDLEKAGQHKGNETAKVRIVEFSDFQCPACGSAYGVVKQVMANYSSDIYFTYRHMPLSSIHPYAQKAAEASECADEQGKFWEMHDLLFENQEALKAENLMQYAAQLGLNSKQFNSCLVNGKYASKVASDFSYGVSIGVNSTPTFFINGKKYSNLSYEQFRSIIEGLK